MGVRSKGSDCQWVSISLLSGGENVVELEIVMMVAQFCEYIVKTIELYTDFEKNHK